MFGNKVEGFHWFCSICQPNAIDVIKTVQHIKEKHDQLDARMTAVEEKLEGMDNCFDDRVQHTVRSVMQEEMTKLKDTVSQSLDGASNHPKVGAETIRDLVKDEIAEARQRDNRRLNLIVKNLPENGKDDKDVEALVKTLGLKTREARMIKFERIGKADGRPRLVKVKCDRSDQKRKILENCKKLADNETYKDVYVCRDMTKAEQKAQKELRDELKRKRNVKDGKKYFIRGNKVVSEDEDEGSSDDTESEEEEEENEDHGTGSQVGSQPKN